VALSATSDADSRSVARFTTAVVGPGNRSSAEEKMDDSGVGRL